MVPGEPNQNVQYFIAASAIGMAIGNIMLARRLKLFGRTPHSSNYNSSSRGNQNFKYSNYQNASQKKFNLVSSHLLTLGLSVEKFSVPEIKEAYRKIALNTHPDRFTTSDMSLRRSKEKLFKDATHAYAELMKYSRTM